MAYKHTFETNPSWVDSSLVFDPETGTWFDPLAPPTLSESFVPPTALATTSDTTPAAADDFYSPEADSQKELRKKGRRRLGATAGAAVAGELSQAGLASLETPGDKYVTERLGEIENEEKGGLTAAEIAPHAEAVAATGADAAAATRAESAQRVLLGDRSAGQQQRTIRRADNRVALARVKGAADLVKAKAKKFADLQREKRSLIGFKHERTLEKRKYLSDLIGSMGALAGDVIAKQGITVDEVPGVDPGLMRMIMDLPARERGPALTALIEASKQNDIASADQAVDGSPKAS